MSIYVTRWLSGSAAVIGRGHERSGVPCQDSVFSYTNNGVHVTALSDGAGSRRFSHFGSRVLTRTICDCITDHFEEFLSDANNADHILAKNIAKHLASELELEARRHDCSLHELGATLLFVALRGERYLIGHLGDGVIAGRTPSGFRVISKPRQQEFHNFTDLFCQEGDETGFHFFRGFVADYDGFLLMSDGAAESLYHRASGRLSSALNEMLDWFDDAPAADVSESVRENVEDLIRSRTLDDCSLAVVRRLSMSLSTLQSREQGFCRAYLSTRNKIEYTNRIRVLEALASLDVREMKQSVAEMARALGLAPQTVRRHLTKCHTLGIMSSISRP